MVGGGEPLRRKEIGIRGQRGKLEGGVKSTRISDLEVDSCGSTRYCEPCGRIDGPPEVKTRKG